MAHAQSFDSPPLSQAQPANVEGEDDGEAELDPTVLRETVFNKLLESVCKQGVYVCVCEYVCMYVCVYVCMCMCLCVSGFFKFLGPLGGGGWGGRLGPSPGGPKK